MSNLCPVLVGVCLATRCVETPDPPFIPELDAAKYKLDEKSLISPESSGGPFCEVWPCCSGNDACSLQHRHAGDFICQANCGPGWRCSLVDFSTTDTLGRCSTLDI